MACADARELGDLAIERMLRIEVRLRRRRRRAEQLVLVVARDLATRTCPAAHPGRRPCRRSPARRPNRWSARRAASAASRGRACRASAPRRRWRLGVRCRMQHREAPGSHDCRGRSAAAAPPRRRPRRAVGAEQLGQLVGRRRRSAHDVDDRAREARNRARSAACRRACSRRCAPGPCRPSRLRRRCGSSGCPCLARAASIAGTNFCQNSGFTCCAVSMRKPSTP